MWSLLTQDFSDLADVLKFESAGLVEYFGQLASDVADRGGLYAGDEFLKWTTEQLALPKEQLRRLQESEATYLLPIQPDESTSFEAWMAGNPLSSSNALKRQLMLNTAAKDGDCTPTRPSSEWPDEPIDETRQRLLDYNATVLQWYMQLVGSAVSPRASPTGSPVPFSKQNFDEAASSQNLTTPARASTADGDTTTTSENGQRLTEDAFFDRYFFRLAQLRIVTAKQREDGATPTAGAGEAAPLSADQRSSKPPSTAQDVGFSSVGGKKDAAAKEDFGAMPLFAKRMMTAASGLVSGIDNALNSVASGVDSHHAQEDSSGNVDPNDLPLWKDTQGKIAGLECVVQELQTVLRRERLRVQQLSELLERHHIPLPPPLPETSVQSSAAPSTGASPAKGAEATPQNQVVTSASSDKSVTALNESGANQLHHVDPARVGAFSSTEVLPCAENDLAPSTVDVALESYSHAEPPTNSFGDDDTWIDVSATGEKW